MAADRPRPARFYVPRSHRVFAVFASAVAAEAALSVLPPVDLRREPWLFAGPTGASELDPGSSAGPARLFSWLFSHNVEHLQALSDTVSSGAAVVAVWAKNLAQAERAAARLREHGAEWCIYTAHANFVPLS